MRLGAVAAAFKLAFQRTGITCHGERAIFEICVSGKGALYISYETIGIGNHSLRL
jgi:hypothetical protein